MPLSKEQWGGKIVIYTNLTLANSNTRFQASAIRKMQGSTDMSMSAVWFWRKLSVTPMSSTIDMTMVMGGIT